MDVVTLCPFVASKLVWQAHTGAYACTVIIKATFELEPNTSVLATEQDPVHERDAFWDDDPRRSVRVPSDLVPYKPRPEVMLVGHAYAPGKQPVRSLTTRFVVGDVDKSIEVWCDRKFRELDAQLIEGQRFTRMPLVWERASGGPESANPVGKRFDAAPDAYGTITLGNLQPLGHLVSKPSDTFVPVCYAPIAPSWPGRTQRLGRLTRKFVEGTWKDEPLPADFDATFFQAASPDQVVAQIRADERIVLENLHPEQTRLVTSLPGLRPRAIADRATGEREEISLVGDTLWIDSDLGLCCVVWRGHIGLRHPLEAGRIAVWVDGLPMIASARTQVQTAAVVEDDLEATRTLFGTVAPAAALPFVGGTSSLSQSSGSLALDIANWVGKPNDDGTGTIREMLSAPTTNALPFERQGSSQAASLAPMTPSVPSVPVAMPFVAASVVEARFEPADPYAKGRMPVPAFANVPQDEPTPAKVDVAPPAMIGPLAKVEMAQDKPVAVEEVQKPAAEKAPAEQEEDDGEVVELSLEETATIAAELAEGQLERAKVFEAHQLTKHAWTTNEERWEAALEEEDERGKNELGARYDAAYVKRVEGFRGTITAGDYAKLVVGMERGREEAALEELRIHEDSVLPIQRVWAKRMATDMKVAKEVMGAMRGVRAG